MHGMQAPLALELTTTLLVIVAVISVVLLVLIIVAPWRAVRKEPPLDKAVEAKLLLHRNPDEPTGEVPRVSSVPIDDGDDEFGVATSATWPTSPAPTSRSHPPRELVAAAQVTAKNMRASQVVSPSTDARAWAQPPRALSRSTSTTRSSSSPGRTTRRKRTFSTPANSASFPA